MSSLGSVTSQLQKLAAVLVGSKPDRDELVRERDTLLESPPPAPVDTLAVLERPSCSCPHCSERFDREQSVRLAHASWAGRVTALERQLFMLTWGNPDSKDDEAKGRDEPGLALAELCTELLHAIDANKMRPWERILERDGRGKPLKAWETAPQIGAVTMQLVALYRHATGPMVYLSTPELTKAIEQTRASMGAALVTPLKRPMDPEAAERAGLQPGEPGEAERHGLIPGTTPDVTSGTIRFSRRGRA